MSKASYCLEQLKSFSNQVRERALNNCFSLDDIFSKFISSIVVLKCVESEEILIGIIINFSKVYIDMVIGLYAFLVLQQFDEKINVTKEVWEKFWMDHNNQLKVFSYIQPYFELILGTLFSLFDFKKDLVEKAVNTHEYNLELYSQVINKEFFMPPIYNQEFILQISNIYKQ